MGLGATILAYFLLENKITRFLRTTAGRVAGTAAFIIFSAVAASFAAFIVLTQIQSMKAPGNGRDAIIVLGSGIVGERLTVPLEQRLKKALEYAKLNPDAPIVVSGGQGPGESVSEAKAMADYLIANGVPKESVILEEASTSTQENFQFSKAILNELLGESYSVVFVTNRFHAFRASRSAKKEGLDAQILAAPSKPFFMLPNNYFREYIAILYYFATGKH
jgi:uncharacterized SAM-binding protein YcdF (DUF218 family)